MVKNDKNVVVKTSKVDKKYKKEKKNNKYKRSLF